MQAASLTCLSSLAKVLTPRQSADFGDALIRHKVVENVVGSLNSDIPQVQAAASAVLDVVACTTPTNAEYIAAAGEMEAGFVFGAAS